MSKKAKKAKKAAEEAARLEEEARLAEEAKKAEEARLAAEAAAKKSPTLASARKALLRGAKKVASTVTQAVAAVVPPPPPPPPVKKEKVKRPRFVREKAEKREPVTPVGPLYRGNTLTAKLMSKNLALPPKEDPRDATKPMV